MNCELSHNEWTIDYEQLWLWIDVEFINFMNQILRYTG